MIKISYTGTEIFNIAIAIIDELNETGLVSDTQIKEYKYRAPYLLDIWQREKPRILKTIDIARHPIKNLLGKRYDTLEHINEDIIMETSTVAKSAVFYVSDQADIYIEEYTGGTWVNVAGFYSKDDGTETVFTGLISVPTLTTIAKYKCRLTATNKVRIRFSGSYYYLFYNIALFEPAFPTCAKVPEYGEYVKYAMPSDFDNITEIVEEYPQSYLSHKWEGTKDLYVNYDFDGILKITYNASPAKITSLTQTLEVDEALATTGAYFLAEWFAISDMNTDLAVICKNKYNECRTQLVKKRPLSTKTIQDVYDINFT